MSRCGSMRAVLSGGVFELEMVDERPGIVVFRAHGVNAATDFSNEAGGHRWQRVPPTERRGRVHTSTVTVAVLPEPRDADVPLRDCDVEWTAQRGSGPGGQHRNKTESAVLVRHKPSGLTAYCQSERSQHRNRAAAMAVLRARLWERQQTAAHGERSENRRQQIGSGMRGDKRRTIRQQDGQVVDHVTGQRWRFEAYQRGEW